MAPRVRIELIHHTYQAFLAKQDSGVIILRLFMRTASETYLEEKSRRQHKVHMERHNKGATSRNLQCQGAMENGHRTISQAARLFWRR